MTEQTTEKTNTSDTQSTNKTATQPSALDKVIQVVKALLLGEEGYLKLNYFTLFWIFVVSSIIGLGIETIYHAIVFGGYESRAGLVWGPFSPIYGVGALFLTIFLNRLYNSHNLVIFLIAMIVGSIVEYGASLGMEFFWGAIAWDYSDTFGSIHGRTNFMFGMMWGLLGLIWVRLMLPLVKRILSRVNQKHAISRVVTVILSIFMVVNIICTFLAIERQSQRKAEIPATDPIQQFCDTCFPDEFLEARFQNMTVTAKK